MEDGAEAPAPASVLHPPSSFGTSLALSLVVTGLSAWTAGPTLGLFIGGLFAVTILVPPLAASRTKSVPSAAAALLGVTLVWTLATLRGAPWGAIDLLRTTACLVAFTLAIVGLLRGLRAARVEPTVGGAVVLAAGLAWLALPVWLSPWLDRLEPAVDALVRAHPVLAINGAVAGLAPWTEMPVMYRLTSLGQDVPYRLPGTVWPCVAAHAVTGLVGWLGSAAVSRVRARWWGGSSG